MNQETRNFELEKEMREAEEAIKKTDKHISHKIELLTVILGILSVIILILVIAFANIIIDNGNRVEEDSVLLSQKNQEIKALLSNIDSKDKRIESLEDKLESLEINGNDKIKELEEQLAKQKEINKDLYNDNKGLKEYTESFDSQIDEVRERLEKYEKYDYAMFSQWDSEKRNDLNYDYIAELEELVAFKPVDDIDFYLSWILIESDGVATAKNPNSTAKGFGQFLDGTSQSVYNTYLADKYGMEWYPDIVIEHPDIALDMMVEYVNYLYLECSRSIPATIDCYRGLHDSAYIAQFEKNLSKSGKTIAIINNKAEEKYQSLLTAVG